MVDYWWLFVGVWMNGFGIGWISLNAVNALLEKNLCRSHRKTALRDNGDPGALACDSPGMRVGLDASDPEFDSQSPLLGSKDQDSLSEWLFSSYAAHRERDEALLEALRQRRENLLARHQVVRGKAQALLCDLADGQEGQELLADLDALAEEIRQTF